MVSVAAFFLMILAFAVIGYPLMRPASRDWALPAVDDETDRLEEERNSAYRAIKELEQEYRLGHLSSEDYTELRERYVERAARVLQRLDASRGPSARGGQKRASGCPACGARRHAGDRFCGACGQALGAVS
jgi:hypothetical protein